MSTSYEQLLDEVCVGLGFCGGTVDGEPSHVDQLLPRSGLVDANTFADALFKAEGLALDSPAAVKHRPSICAAFVRHFGETEVHASLFR